ncbi:hypothetical protein SAMN04488522_102905 [Pedobacter caeni]|uniref:Uncharacterized protein n=1 Tax=Pedobacter caeni TaxID=288992 RepID=A0A1M5AVG4_9SPHI|nr:hypothetical protein SAMN04488522_102905 [Pedobacter caeni]
MNKSIVPSAIALIQLLSLIHLYYTFKYGSSHIPMVFIELNIMAVCNMPVLVLGYFLHVKSANKMRIWWVPIALAVAVIVVLLITYLIMFVNK